MAVRRSSARRCEVMYPKRVRRRYRRPPPRRSCRRFPRSHRSYRRCRRSLRCRQSLLQRRRSCLQRRPAGAVAGDVPADGAGGGAGSGDGVGAGAGADASAAAASAMAELLWLMVAADPTVGNPTEMPMFRKASQLSVSRSRNHPRGNGQVTHDWLLKQYRRKLSENGMDPAKVKLFKLHSPRIIGATTLFASGKSDMHLKSKGRWAGDIAFIYARFCTEISATQ